ncbi:hypothetical protein [Flavobacterium sp.]|uniref:glucosamine inositolphosphorylceramide transferase family protein n=1 Tax=Flavobacterium sp. TaxID=239 RepID=UPI0025CBD1EE|nr:hypothetical protein [Flavobacterium sp.]
MIKKQILILSIIAIVLIGILNHRIPFFKPAGGPWSIGFGFTSNYPEKIDFKKNKVYSFEQVKKHIDSTQFIADPFFIKEKDSFFIFFEHKKVKNYHAVIGLLTSKDGHEYQYRGTVLKAPFHLSYPQVFKYRNEFYMLPESQGANHVLLYKSHNFPYGWKVCDTLIADTRLKDPTIYLSDSLNILVGSDKNFKMHMYQSNQLNGKWTLHKRPIVMEGSESRPGGRILADKSGLILPVQSFHKGYGSGLSIYRLQFKNNSYTVKKEKHLLLQSQQNIKEFNAGMHHLDIQKIDHRYYSVYDGNQLQQEEKVFNYKAPVLLNYLDFKDWCRQNFIE